MSLGGVILVWIIIAVVTLLIDVITSGFLFVWFTIGAIAAIIALNLGYPLDTQIATFVVVSCLFFAVGFPLAKKLIKKTVPKTKTMEEEYIGREFIAEGDISFREKAKIDGIYWTVQNNDKPIRKGDKYKIVSIQGNKLIVKKTV
ncbi:MAG: NfeD family protein [Bacillota bacterium]|nr:NfeD family protein [Bacillota bacterium]